MRHAWVLAILLVPLAVASSRGEVSSAVPALITGNDAFIFADGVAHVVSDDSTFAVTFTNVSGPGHAYAWRAASSNDYRLRTDQDAPRELTLDDATIRWSVDHEEYSVSAQTLSGGALVLGGGTPVAKSRPAWLVEPFERYATDDSYDPDPLPTLRIVAPEGWGASKKLAIEPPAGPLPKAPSLTVQGRALVELNGGTLTIEHRNGTAEEIRLGETAETSLGAAQVERRGRVILELTAGEVRAPVEGRWIVAGPNPVWEIDGSAEWSRASGVQNGIPFKDRPVRVDGAFTLTPDPSSGGLLEEDRFVLAGSYELTAGGLVLTPRSRADPTQIAAWTLAGALATLLAFLGSPHLAGRVIAPFYTRISRDDIATHPARSQICEHLTGTPGVHLRDLHRRIGGAWGTFSFHLGMLRQAGVIRFEREGRYVAVYLAHQEIARAGPRTVTAQKVLEALPHDGSPMPVTKLRERVGLSRQLLDHHLAALVQQERIVIDAARPRRVSRIVAR